MELTSDQTIWDGPSPDDRVRQAYVQFVAMCKSHGVRNLDSKEKKQ